MYPNQLCFRGFSTYVRYKLYQCSKSRRLLGFLRGLGSLGGTYGLYKNCAEKKTCKYSYVINMWINRLNSWLTTKWRTVRLTSDKPLVWYAGIDLSLEIKLFDFKSLTIKSFLFGCEEAENWTIGLVIRCTQIRSSSHLNLTVNKRYVEELDMGQISDPIY